MKLDGGNVSEIFNEVDIVNGFLVCSVFEQYILKRKGKEDILESRKRSELCLCFNLTYWSFSNRPLLIKKLAFLMYYCFLANSIFLSILIPKKGVSQSIIQLIVMNNKLYINLNRLIKSCYTTIF